MLLAAFVDLINRTRGNVITLETGLLWCREPQLADRHARCGGYGTTPCRTSCSSPRSPDVIVIEDLRGGEVAPKPRGGRIRSSRDRPLAAHSASSALERIVDQVPAERRPQIRRSCGVAPGWSRRCCCEDGGAVWPRVSCF